MDEKQLQGYIDWAKRGNLSGKSAARYFELSGLIGSDFDAAMSAFPAQEDPNVYTEQPKKDPDPYAGFEPIDQEGLNMFGSDLDFIAPDLFNKTEEEAVNLLRNKYNRYGFQFEESVPGLDFIKVTAPNGKSERIAFGLPGVPRVATQNMLDFMNQNMIQDTKKLNDLAKANYLSTTVFDNVGAIQSEAKSIEEQSKELQSRLNEYNDLLDVYDVAVAGGDQQEIDRFSSEIRDLKQDIQNQQGALTDRSDAFQGNVGRYYANRESQGSDFGAVASLFLGSGVENVVEGMVEFGILGARAQVNPAIYTSSKVRDLELKEAREKSDFTDWGSWVQQLAGVSEEKVDEFSRRNLATQVVSGVAESLPSFISPSKIFNVFALTGQTLKQWEEMTSGPEWDDVSETKKAAFAVPFIFAQVALERYGFTNIKAVNNLSGKILSRVFGKSVGKLTPKTLAELVEQDIKSALGRAGVVSGNAFLAEAETGALQEISAEGLKQLYNKFGDTEFDVTESFGEFVSQVATSALHEGLGGLMLGSRAAFKASRRSFSDEDMMALNLLRDDAVMQFREANRKKKSVLGDMTQPELRAEAENDRVLSEIVRQIPADASISTQKQLFRKLQREAGLKDEISKNGARMSFREAEELKKVQSEIDDIGKNYEKLTPEQKQAEMREIVQPITPTGGVTVETATGEKITIEPEDVTQEEDTENYKAEAVQLDLFDEFVATDMDLGDEETAQQRVMEGDEVSDFAEVKISEATTESMGEAGFSTEFQSLVSKVRDSVGENISRSGDDKLVNHKTNASIMEVVRRVDPEEASKLQFGDFVFGFVIRTSEGPQEIHLLDTNSAEFTDQVKEAARKLGVSYKVASAVDLVTEEVVTHYMLQDFFGPDGTKREEFYGELTKLAESNPALKRLIEQTEAEYSDAPEAKQQEEVIAAFFKDYVKSPSSYRNIWQRIADWWNNFFAGKRVINSESDLMNVARNVNNIISGVSVDVQAPQAQPQEGDTSFAKTSGFNYLQNETIYYDFDRQSGVQYNDWVRDASSRSTPKKIKVSDYNHFKNWYAKMTANGKFPGIISNMYFMKDGKRHAINPPKPRLDRDGNLVEMKRIPTVSDLRAKRSQDYSQALSEERRQYSAMLNELGELWRNSRFSNDTLLTQFHPEKHPNLRRGYQDFEGLIIAKKNLLAAINSDITAKQLKEMRGKGNFIDKAKFPDVFNMSGMTRISDAGEAGGEIKDLNSRGDGIVFGKTSGSRKRTTVDRFEVVKGYNKRLGKERKDIVIAEKKKELQDVKDVKVSSMRRVENLEDAIEGRPTWVIYFDQGGNITYKPPGSKSRKISAGGIKELHLSQTKAKSLGGPVQAFSHSDTKSANVSAALTDRFRFIFLSETPPDYEAKELQIDGKPYFENQQQVDTLHKKLKESNGEVAIAIAVNDSTPVVDRPGFVADQLKALLDAAKDDPSLQQAILETFNKNAKGIRPRGVSKEKREEAEKILREANISADSGLTGKIKRDEDLDLQIASFEDLKKLLVYLRSSLGEFEGNRRISELVNLFAVQGTKPYPGFLTKAQAKKMLIDPDLYVDGKFANSGDIMAVSILDLNEVSVEQTRSGLKTTVQTDEKSNFKYSISGGKEVIMIDNVVNVKDIQVIATSEEEKNRIKVRGLGKGAGGVQGLMTVLYSKATGRVASKAVQSAGRKGVSMNQIVQSMGKASEVERVLLQSLIKKFPDSDFIPLEDLDQFFEGKMLQPLEEEKNHADYGLDRLLGRSYRQAKAVTIPFIGDEEIYGTAGIFEDHFGFPVHAHLRIFSHPNDPGVLYVSEIQSDTYQKGLDEAYDGSLTRETIIEQYASDEVDVSVQNLPFLKYILENYDQYRTLILVAAGGRDNAIQANWWDDVLTKVEIVPEGRIDDAPNMESLLSNAVANDPNFNVRAFRILLRQYALSNLKAPVNSTSKQIDDIINDHFNKYPYVQPGEKNNLGNFSKDLVISIDYMADVVSDIALGEELIDMSPEERMKVYDGAVEAVEKYETREKEEKVEAIPSAKASWEKQLMRYAIKQAQENGQTVVRFPTEKTAADIQWWDASDAELDEYMSEEFGVDRMFEGPMGQEMLSEERAKQRPLRKRYRDIPKTLRSIGLDSRIVQDQQGNRWYEVDVPPSDQRMIMFSKTSGRNNMGDIGGATWEARERSSMEEWSDMWLTRLQDKYRKVFQLQEDVAKKTEGQVKKDEDFRMAEELMYGKAAEDLAKLDDATDRITMTLLENKLTVEELDEYMYALHAKERNAVIRERTEGKNQMGSGMSDLDAQKILDGKSEEKKQQLEEAASIVREIMQNTRDTMVELGLESQETIDAFEKMFKDYVPLQGKSVDEEDLAYSPYPNGGTGFSVSGATTKKARGRFTQTTNIVAQAIGQNAAVHVKGRTNEAMNALYNLAQNNPNPNVWQVLDKEEDGYKSDDPNIVSVRVNGVQKAIRFKDASYAQSLRKMNMPQTNYFVKAMGSINSWLRAAFTSRNPEFILSNFSRDIQSAVFNASAESEMEGGFLNGTAAMKRIFKLVGPSLKTLVRDEVGGKTDPLIMKYYEEFKADGGKTGWAYQKSLEDIASQLQVDDSGKTAGQKVIGGVKGALEFVEGMNDAFENSIRLSSYIAAREAGVSREKAAQFAKNITVNFNKQGEWGAAVNATYLFFNASVQGTARLGRSLLGAKPPVRPDGSRREWYERATTAQKAAGGMIIMNALLTLLNRAASDEDEDGTLFYNKIPDYVKERNMIIMRPDGKNYWKVPMPYGYNIFANIGTTSVEVASGDKEALEGLAFMAMSVVNAFSPISFGQAENLGTQFAKTSIPTAFKPFFEAFAFNETYFGGPVKAEQYPFGTPKPNSSMSFRSPEEIKQFFSWLNEATGGSEDVPGIIDINPDGGWYIFEYFLGGTGRFVTRSIETGRKIVADRSENPVDLDFNDIPFMRIVYGEPSKYYDMQLFKDREVEIKQLVAEYKENRIPDAGDRYKGIGQLNEDLKKINKALKAVRAEKRAAKKITNYSERVSTLQRLMDRERKLVMMFNKRYEQFRGKD